MRPDNLGKAKDRSASKEPKYIVDQNGQRFRPPEFKGGFEGWVKYLHKKLRYPKDAKEKGIEGKVTVQFIVDGKGRIRQESVKVVESLSETCDMEAIRLIKTSPPWTPARNIDEGMNIESQNTYPIRFQLRGDKHRVQRSWPGEL